MATIPIYSPVSKSWFDHIKIDHANWDGMCPLQDDIEEINSESVIGPDSEHMSWLLSQILDGPGMAATREIVRNRRSLTLMLDYVDNTSGGPVKYFSGGSQGDGFAMMGGDMDSMYTYTDVMVTYPDYYPILPEDIRHKTILYMRQADCQPGYVALELGSLGQGGISPLVDALVPDGDSRFISSELFRQRRVEECREQGLDYEPSGPCTTLNLGDSHADFASSFQCSCWPKEAEEWVYRTRLYGWPTQDLRDKIVQSGCHIVPVGDKSSSDTFLQWRISFLTAERRLVHSLSHQQFRIYGLLKYFLKQIKDLLEDILGDDDILCSYFMKTLIFYAVENSPSTFWQDKNTFVCFRLCLRILIDWINSGICPNYFIKSNNMFKRKVHGERQQKLLHILTDMYHIKWAILSVGTFYSPSIEELLHEAVHGQLSDVLPTSVERECDKDINFIKRLAESEALTNSTSVMSPLRLLSESQSDTDEVIAYYLTATTLSSIACTTFIDHQTSSGNKQKYRDLRKCKRLLTPRAAMCTSPGLLELATFHYLTGNCRKSLEMCGEVTSYRGWYIVDGSESKDRDRYQRLYCGRRYSLYQKMKESCVFDVVFYKEKIQFCLPHLHLELTIHPLFLRIPPLPYAVFLSFLCYHDLGDTRRRDAALLRLRAVKYDPTQGGHKHYIVHTLLGICYQTVGDNRRAIRSYKDSMDVTPEWNPAIERIEALFKE